MIATFTSPTTGHRQFDAEVTPTFFAEDPEMGVGVSFPLDVTESGRVLSEITFEGDADTVIAKLLEAAALVARATGRPVPVAPPF